MLSKRSTIYFFISALFIILACSTTDLFPIPDATETPKPAPDRHDVTIPEDCYREGYQTYVGMERNYCFSYPAGYYITSNSTSNNIELKYLAEIPSQEEITSMKDIPETLNISLIIFYELNSNEPKLQNFALSNPQNDNATKLTPWKLNNTKAFIRRIVIEDAENNLKNVSYYIYAKRGEQYYSLCFQSPSLLSDTGEAAKKMEDLFFLVLDTFTFLN